MIGKILAIFTILYLAIGVFGAWQERKGQKNWRDFASDVILLPFCLLVLFAGLFFDGEKPSEEDHW